MKQPEKWSKIAFVIAGAGLVTVAGISHFENLRGAIPLFRSSASQVSGSSAAKASASSPRSETAASQSPGLMDIQYHLYKRDTIASNQIALWIEDGSHRYVRTLIASSFTAKGGWRERPQALPEWRTAASWSHATQEEIDSVLLPEQSPGVYHVYWDCTDTDGRPVPAGTYYVRMEGNIYWDNRVVFSVPVAVGESSARASASPQYLPGGDQSSGTILSDVSAAFTPGEKLSEVKREVFTSTRGS